MLRLSKWHSISLPPPSLTSEQPESQNDNTDGVIRKISEQSYSSAHSKRAVNGDVDITTTNEDSTNEVSTRSDGTLRHVQNPIYTASEVDNPLYSEQAQAADIYSVPGGPTGPDVGEGREWIYSSPVPPTPQGNGEGEYSYATIGSNAQGDNNPEYATPTGDCFFLCISGYYEGK